MIDELPGWKELQPFVEEVVLQSDGPVQIVAVCTAVAESARLSTTALQSRFPSGASRYEDRISDALRDLVKRGKIERVSQGWFQATDGAVREAPLTAPDLAERNTRTSLRGLKEFSGPGPRAVAVPDAPQRRDGAPGDPAETRWWCLDERLRKTYEDLVALKPGYSDSLHEVLELHRELVDTLDAAVIQWERDVTAAGGDPAFVVHYGADQLFNEGQFDYMLAHVRGSRAH